MEQEQSGDKTYSFPLHRLGMLEVIVHATLVEKDKRKRRTGVQRIIRILKDLSLIARSEEVVGVGTGLSYLGERELYVICMAPVAVEVAFPQGEGA